MALTQILAANEGVSRQVSEISAAAQAMNAVANELVTAINANVKIIDSKNADWLREKAISVSQKMFEANPDVNVVYAHNDPMGEAAVISAKSAGKAMSTMLFVGIDALPTPDGGIKSVIEGRLGATYVYPTGGAEAIDWAVKILEEKAQPPKSVVLETEEVLKTNAEALYAKYGGK